MSTGRSVTPLRRPGFSSVRDLHILDLVIEALPPRAEIRLAAGQGWAPPLLAGPPFITELPIAGLSSSALQLEAKMEPAGGFEGRFSAMAEPITLGSGPSTPASAGELSRLVPLFHPPVLPEGELEAAPSEGIRSYQVTAIERLTAHTAFLLADDPGTGKSTSVCLALAALFRGRQARRALVVCPKASRRHWLDELTRLAPGLTVHVVRGDRRARDHVWRTDAHVLVGDYQVLAEDIARGSLADERLQFDVLVMDQLSSVSRRSALVADSLTRIDAGRRWGLAGAMPLEAADWRAIFRLIDPKTVEPAADPSLPILRDRFLPHVLRRRKSELASQLPKLTRQQVWLDLDEGQAVAYRETLAEERHRLSQLGGSATLTHVRAAVERLQQVCAFAPESLDGPKVRALVDLMEEVALAGGKVVVFSQFPDAVLDRLQPILEAYGAVRLEGEGAEADQERALESFRGRPDRRILLADANAPRLGPMPVEASYVVHFDHDWRPERRHQLETQLFPDLGPRPPTSVYEYWMAETIDETLHTLLVERGAPAAELSAGPAGTITVEDWLDRVLEIPRQRSRRAAPGQAPEGTAWLPGTNVLRSQLSELPPERLVAGVGMFFRALGHGEAHLVRPVTEEGADLIVERGPAGAPERLFVRCLRAIKNVGVAEGRSLLEDLEAQRGFMGACLVVTTDFTEALRKLADGSEGRLSLVSGAELYRHLHILGWL